MPQVRAVDAHTLAVGQHAHVVPVDLRVTEARPAVRLGLLHEGIPPALCASSFKKLVCSQ